MVPSVRHLKIMEPLNTLALKWCMGNEVQDFLSLGGGCCLGLLDEILEELPHLGKLAPESWSKMKHFGLGLKAKRSKTKVSFGLENLTAVIFAKFSSNWFLRHLKFKLQWNYHNSFFLPRIFLPYLVIQVFSKSTLTKSSFYHFETCILASWLVWIEEIGTFLREK